MILPFDFAGTRLLATLSGALYWPARRLLVVADLHLEKGSAFAGLGVPLPPYDSRATIAGLAAAVAAFAPTTVVCLGDSFHDADADRRLAAADRAALAALAGDRRWLWLAGNHDRQPPAGIGGAAAAELILPPLVFRHAAAIPAAAKGAGGDGAATTGGEVSGHYHPKASVVVAGRRITARCYVVDRGRLILPAFGAYAGGLDVFDPAFAGLLTPSFAALLIGRGRLHRVAARRLTAPVAPPAPLAWAVPPPAAPPGKRRYRR